MSKIARSYKFSDFCNFRENRHFGRFIRAVTDAKRSSENDGTVKGTVRQVTAELN